MLNKSVNQIIADAFTQMEELYASKKELRDKFPDSDCNIPQEAYFDSIPDTDCDIDPTITQEELPFTPISQEPRDYSELKSCVDAISKLSEANQVKATKIQTLSEDTFKLEMLRDNVFALNEYHKARLYYFSNDSSPVDVSAILSSLSSLATVISDYSTAISISPDYYFFDVKTLSLNSYSPFTFTVDVRDSDYYKTSTNTLFQSQSGLNYNLNIESDNNKEFHGALYDEYYNKLSDIDNNFFTFEERGLYRKFENKDDIKDIDIFQAFYSDFNNRFKIKKEYIYAKKINTPYLSNLVQTLKIFARLESSLYRIAFVGNADNPILSKSSQFVSLFDQLQKQIDDNNKEIDKLTKEISKEELIKSMLNFSCVKNNYGNIEKRNDNGLKLNEFDFDPTNPNYYKACWWLKFCQLATINGLLPFPDTNNPSSLRYWPVGLIVGLIKVPLPMIWIPLVEISSPDGVLVIFISQCGILPCPYVLYIANDGSKQFIATLRGQSEVFGHRGNASKFSVMLPAAAFGFDLNLNLKNKFNWEGVLLQIKNMLLDFVNRFPLPDTSFNFNVDINCRDIANILTKYIDSITFPVVKWPDKDYLSGIKKFSDELNDIASLFNVNGFSSNFKKHYSLKELLKKKFIELDIDFRNLNIALILKDVVDAVKVDSDKLLQWLSKVKLNFPLICKDVDLSFLDDTKETLDKALQILITQIDIANIEFSKIEGYILNLIDKLPIPELNVNVDLSLLFGILQKIYNLISALQVKLNGLYLPKINIDFNAIVKPFLSNVIRNSICDLMNELLGYIVGNNEDWNKAYKLYIDGGAGNLCDNTNDYKVGDGKVNLIKGNGNNGNADRLEGVKFSVTVPDLNVLLKRIIAKYIEEMFKHLKLEVERLLNIPIIAGMFDAGVTVLDIIMMASNAKNIIKKAIDSVHLDIYWMYDEQLTKKAKELLAKLEQYSWPVSAAICASGNSKIIRNFHPFLEADDLPAWEHLSLNNSLFVCFLDEFSHIAKKYGGFMENYV